MTKLFEHTLINGMSLSNRFVRSATWEGLADKDGSVTPKLIEMMSAVNVSMHAPMSALPGPPDAVKMQRVAGTAPKAMMILASTR